MSQEINNNPNQNNEEADLIRLLNYFKNGIKSVFRKLWMLVEFVIQFIILLKKNWILVVLMAVLGAIYGQFIRPYVAGGVGLKKYEMLVKTTSITNFELYAFADEVNNQKSDDSNTKSEGVILAKELGITKMDVEAVEQISDIVNNYHEQNEISTLRGFETDTLFYQAFDLKDFKSNMEKTDYTLQKVKIKVDNDIAPQAIQERFLNYVNNLKGVKREQESKLNSLLVLEKEIKRNLNNIDTLLQAKATASKNSGPAGADQLLVNTASRGNVEADLLRYAEGFTKRLYGTQRMIADSQQGAKIISNLRPVGDDSAISNPIVKYTLAGFILACLIIVGIQFNKYLDRFPNRN